MTLFNEYEAITVTGQALALAVDQALDPLIRDAEAAGYPLRQVEYIINSTVSQTIAERVLRAALTKRRKEREARDAHRPSETT